MYRKCLKPGYIGNPQPYLDYDKSAADAGRGDRKALSSATFDIPDSYRQR